MRLLLKKDYEELRGLIEEVRGDYPMKRYEIEYRLNRIKELMLEKTVPVASYELESGKSYGIPEFSPWATAFDKRNGMKELPNHGDIYITVWTWMNDGEHLPGFMCRDAWGGCTARTTAQVDLLVEFP